MRRQPKPTIKRRIGGIFRFLTPTRLTRKFSLLPSLSCRREFGLDDDGFRYDDIDEGIIFDDTTARKNILFVFIVCKLLIAASCDCEEVFGTWSLEFPFVLLVYSKLTQGEKISRYLSRQIM